MDWIYYLVYFGAAFCLSLAVSWRLPDLLNKLKIYDIKSLPQKRPTAGGIAIAVAVLTLIAATAIFDPDFIDGGRTRLLGLLLAAAIITALGLYDDIKSASPIVKITVQIAAAAVLVAAGIRMGEITNPFASPFESGAWGDVILIVWIVVITNSVNLIDGIDGLAAGVCLISSVALFVIAHIFGEVLLACMAIMVAGALFGFIRLNLPPAKVYLGDTGSLLLGFMLAAISVIERRKGTVTLTLLVPLVAMAVPVIDTSLAFIRRVASGRNPMKGDSQHIHHRLLKLGFTPVQVDYMIYLFTVYLGITAGALSFFPKETTMIVLILLAIGVLLGLELLRSIELDKNGKGSGKDK